MLSEIPATTAISRGPCGVCTSLAMSGGNRLCSCRGLLSVCRVHNSFMFLTVEGLRIVSFLCHDVRCGSPPSVSQLAFLGLCAPGATGNKAAAHIATAAAATLRLMNNSSGSNRGWLQS